MPYTIIRPKTREEWLQHRGEGIGSSEIGTILGLNPFETPYQLWLRKRGELPPKAESIAMRAGHYFEDGVAQYFHDETGKEIIKSSAGDWLIVNRDKPYMRVSPDRLYWIPGMPKNRHNKGILECKTTQLDVDAEDPPKHWFCQLQYQLGVAELSEGALCWCTRGRDFGYREFKFNPDFYEFIEDTITKFYVDNILGGEEPLPINADDMQLKFPREIEGKYLEADDDLIAVHDELCEIKAQLKELDSKKTQREEYIKMAMADAEALVLPGQPTKDGLLATWKAPKNGGNRRFLLK